MRDVENTIDWDDAADGSEGGYTRHGIFIVPDAMREIVSLRAENERIRADIKDVIGWLPFDVFNDLQKCKPATMARIEAVLRGEGD